jgi:hypothetical protein
LQSKLSIFATEWQAKDEIFLGSLFSLQLTNALQQTTPKKQY